MTVIATDTQRASNWLKHVYDPSSGYCFETLAKADILPVDAKSGTVLDAAGDIIAAATLANATYILVDDLTSEETAHKTRVLVLARGPAKVAREALIFAADVDTAGEVDTAVAALLVKGITTDKQF